MKAATGVVVDSEGAAAAAARPSKRILLALLSTPFEAAGRSTRLWLALIRRLPFALRDSRLLVAQILRAGVASLPLVLVASLFVGAVTAVQARYQFHGLIPDSYLGTAVAKFVLIESGPVLTSLLLAGRVGAAIAAEIAAMKEKEEIDALSALGLDPLRYLALPRVLAGLVAVPLLVIIACLFALIGAWLMARTGFGLSTESFVRGARFLFSGYDVLAALVKSACFGGALAFAGLHAGLRAEPGARGAGRAAMRAVVSGCVWILVLDFLIVFLMY
jgi:phospholipid/cholesterol/gamma-HCH transport system permease protein